MSEKELKCGEFLCQCPPYDCDDCLDEQSDENKLNEFIKMLDEQSETAIYAGITLTYSDFLYLVEKLAKEIEFRKYIKNNLNKKDE